MNAQESTAGGFDPVVNELTGRLREVVAMIRGMPPPRTAMTAAIDRGLLHSLQETPRRLNLRNRWVIAAVAAIVLAAVAIGLLTRSHNNPKPEMAATNTPASRNGLAAPSTLDGGQSPRGVAATRAFGSMAGTSPSRSIAVSDNGQFLVSTGGDKPIRLGHQEPFSAQNRLHVWDISAGVQSRPLQVSSGASIAISPDGKWVATGDGQWIDANTGAVKQIANFPADVQGLRFSAAGDLLLAQVGSYTGPAGKEGAVAWILEMPGGAVRAKIPGVWAYTFAAAFTQDGSEVFMMDKDRLIRRWNTKTGKELGHYEPAMENSIRAIAVSPDAKVIAAASTRGDMYLWETGGKLLHQLPRKNPRIVDLTVLNAMDSLAFSPDGTQLAGGAILATALWDVQTGKLAGLLPPHQSGSASLVRFSRDGAKLLAVRGFHGTAGPNGEDLLVYPTTQEWDLAKDLRKP
jgi:WD40 repeat protein